jgi:uncharacterized protein (DUF2384 family)
MSAGVLAAPRAGDAAIVAKAVLRAAEQLSVPGRVLGEVLGLSEASISRMRTGEFPLDRDPKAFEIALLFVRLYRSLDAIVGGDKASASAWLRNHNIALDAAPLDLVRTIPGLMHVIEYLDARRSPI